MAQQQLQHQSKLHEGINKLTLANIQAAKEVMADCFLQINQVWKSFILERNLILDFFDRTIKDHLQSQERSRKRYGQNFTTEFIFVKDGKAVSSMHHYEMQDYIYIQNREKTESLPLFADLEKKGKELLQGVDLTKYPPGKAVYANFGGVHPASKMHPLQKLLLLVQYHIEMKKCGIRWSLGRYSNEKAAGFYVKIGGKELKRSIFERQGKQFPILLVELDLESPQFLFLENNIDGLKEKIRVTLAKSMPKL